MTGGLLAVIYAVIDKHIPSAVVGVLLIWCGHGVFAHNLVKIGGLLNDKHRKTA